MTIEPQSLHAALTELMRAIEIGDGDALRARLADIDRHHAALPEDAPKMLRHYLEKRSYAKAIDFLEGRDEAADSTPNC
jgi:hypothetical protein